MQRFGAAGDEASQPRLEDGGVDAHLVDVGARLGEGAFGADAGVVVYPDAVAEVERRNGECDGAGVLHRAARGEAYRHTGGEHHGVEGIDDADAVPRESRPRERCEELGAVGGEHIEQRVGDEHQNAETDPRAEVSRGAGVAPLPEGPPHGASHDRAEPEGVGASAVIEEFAVAAVKRRGEHVEVGKRADQRAPRQRAPTEGPWQSPPGRRPRREVLG